MALLYMPSTETHHRSLWALWAFQVLYEAEIVLRSGHQNPIPGSSKQLSRSDVEAT